MQARPSVVQHSLRRVNSGYDVLRILLAAVLLIAAGLKCHQLATEPVIGHSILDARLLLIGVVAVKKARESAMRAAFSPFNLDAASSYGLNLSFLRRSAMRASVKFFWGAAVISVVVLAFQSAGLRVLSGEELRIAGGYDCNASGSANQLLCGITPGYSACSMHYATCTTAMPRNKLCANDAKPTTCTAPACTGNKNCLYVMDECTAVQ